MPNVDSCRPPPDLKGLSLVKLNEQPTIRGGGGGVVNTAVLLHIPGRVQTRGDIQCTANKK